MNGSSFAIVRAASAIALCLGVWITHAQVQRGEPLPRRALLGVQCEVAPEGGLRVARVLPGTTAEALGIQVGDVLGQVDGASVGTMAELSQAVSGRVEGASVRIGYSRGGKPLVAEGKMVGRPKQQAEGIEVVYDQVVSQGRRIRVIATHPKGAGPFPTVFLIGGIGGYSIDGEFEAIPYGPILGPLARSGYAIVRVDKPGQGDSEGPAYADLLFDDELDAYVQALRLAKTLPFVDRGRIAIFGHSMGGAFAPLVASQEGVAGVVACATFARTWQEYMLENTRRQAELGGVGQVEADTLLRQTAAISHYLFFEGWTVDQVAKERPELAGAVRAMCPDGKTYSGVGLPFFRQLASKNLADAWSRTKAKVLTLWGENDFVSSASDHQYIAAIVNGASPGSAEYASLPKSDHAFFTTESFADSLSKWGRPGGKFNDNVVAVLQTWLGRVLASG
jgi:pimeloyl-ACP methyl ester carboxylesterase